MYIDSSRPRWGLRLGRTIALGLALSISTLHASDTLAPNSSLKIGGALRAILRHKLSDLKPDDRTSIDYDVLRLNIDAHHGALTLSADYRLYSAESGGPMLKYGWIGYRPTPQHALRLGLITRPFGLSPQSSNNFYFNIDYFVGLEDDADWGMRYDWQGKHHALSLAYYLNDEYPSGSTASPNRFGYDLGGDYREQHELALRYSYTTGQSWRHDLGTSLMVGGLRHIRTGEHGTRYAGAIHYTLQHRSWELKAQLARYAYHAYDHGRLVSQVELSAFGATHAIASKANLLTLGLSHRFTIKDSPLIDHILVYNDLSILLKDRLDSPNSYKNIIGAMLTRGPFIAYIDLILARNHPYLGDGTNAGLSSGSDAGRWSGLIMANFGYYF